MDSMNGKYTGINRIIKSRTFQIFLDQVNDGTFREFFGDWKWIFSYSRRFKWLILLYTVLGALSATLSLSAAYFSKLLINSIAYDRDSNILILLVSMVLSTIIGSVLDGVLSRLNMKVSVDINNRIQQDIFTRVVDADWLALSRYPKGDILNRFSRDVDAVAGNAFSWIPNLIINLYAFAVTFLVLFKTDPNMAWIAVAGAPILVFMSRFIMKRLREYRKQVLDVNSEITSFEMETFHNFDTIKSFGVMGRYTSKLMDWQGKYRDKNLEYNKFEIKARVMMALTSAVVSLGAFAYCLYRLSTGQLLYGDMTFFLTQRGTVSNKFSEMVKTLPGMITSAVSAHRVRELMELQPEKHDKESADVIAQCAEDGLTVEMRDVNYAYDGDRYVYEHSSFLVRPGEIAALLGPSGEGKTTILRLLLGLIHPSDGSVTITASNGVQVEANADLRSLFSYVPQGNNLLSGTIADNLRMVREDASDDELENVLKLACAWDFVSRLPDGMYSSLSERGMGLSEGQAQRIAIARAFLRDAPIIILDEATSALDMETEKAVLENISQKLTNKTCIISTHRHSILKQCTRVYRIHDRRVEEWLPEE